MMMGIDLQKWTGLQAWNLAVATNFHFHARFTMTCETIFSKENHVKLLRVVVWRMNPKLIGRLGSL
jgi:hypothetical protein